MRSASLGVPLLFALAASAQTRFPVPASQLPYLANTTPSHCRLHLSASQRGAPATIWTISREDDADPRIRGSAANSTSDA